MPRSANIVQTTAKLDPLRDGYYWLLSLSWPQFLYIMIGLFLVTNAVFAYIYSQIGGFDGMVAHDFQSAFFFSIHTIATVGYGNIHPQSFLANLFVMVEAMIGMFMIAVTAGLMFAKFSRPTARVVFSKVALINYHNGKRCLTFRVANSRGNHVLEAEMSLVLLRQEVTAEGENLRRMIDLKLERSKTPLFMVSWSVIHVIDETSPLFGATQESLEKDEIQIVATLLGYDSVLANTIHAKHAYNASTVVWDAHFKDALSRLPNGFLHVDYSLFHEFKTV